jgi:acid phosphatase type 7
MRRLAAALVVCMASFSAQAQDAFIIGAGDIAASGGAQRATSDLLISQINSNSGTRVFTLGDNAYERGATSEFNTHYAPTWGRSAIKSRTYPTPGNHDYLTSGASGYYAYFGGVAARPTCGFYTKDLGGSWLGIFMNSETCISAQTSKLENALLSARSRNRKAVTFWHRPRFPIGTKTDGGALAPWWTLLDKYNVPIAVVAHEHFYARVGPRLATGAANAGGTREFIVGTGGNHLRACRTLPPMNEKCLSRHGVLRLQLRSGGQYSWRFIATGGSVLDSGSAVAP